MTRCFHKPKKIITIQGVDYYSACESGVVYFNGDLVVNLSGEPNIPQSNIILPELDNHFELPFQELMVMWPDFGLPNVRVSFWKALHKSIVKQGWRKICIHCGQGHGRAGTALSAMLIANKGFTSIDAVNFIREEHCKSAVETPEQCDYLVGLDFYYNERDPDTVVYPQSSMMNNWALYSNASDK